MILYENGIQGLSDSLFAGAKGSAHRLVGVDYRSTPGLIKVHQKLSKHSGTTVDEFCKVSLAVSDGSTLWFSSTSGKIWREVSGTYTLVHTTVPTSGTAGCTGAEEYDGDVYWATEDYLHKIDVAGISGTWADVVQQNLGKFAEGVREHPMAIQNLALYIGDGIHIGKMQTPYLPATPPDTSSTSFSVSSGGFSKSLMIRPASTLKYPEYVQTDYLNVGSSATGTKSIAVKPGTNRGLLVVVTSWREDSTTPATETSVTFDGTALSSLGGGTYFSGAIGTGRAVYNHYHLVAPSVKTANVVVTWAGTETANRAVHIFQFNNVRQASFTQGGSDISTTGATSLTLTETADMTTYPYNTRFVYTRTRPTATHTLSDIDIGNEATENGRVSASVHTVGVSGFEPASALALKAPEYITDLHPFDVDLLIGTKIDNTNKARVLRWDTESSVWNAEDDVEEDGINAFIRDDNYVYVSAGNYGRLYFYDGEKLMPYTKMPGDWSPSKQATIHRNAVAFHMGIPVFGVSNVTGNPTLQGVYGFGKYSKDYRPTLSLDFPISENVFSTIEIGSILVKGADMFVSWKNGATFGVDKLDWSNKYTGAYIETPVLTALGDRSNLKTLVEAWCDYYSLPANTNVRMYFIKKHGDSFAELTTRKDEKLLQLRARETQSDVSSLRLRFDFVVSGNNAPEVENFGVAMGMRKERV
jgi:hypothetical protein